jgi:hypothetical protein
MITTPGFYPDIPADEYHADPCPIPSLSSSIAKIILEQSPLHAWHCHPRLNEEMDADSDPTRPKEIGTAAHKLILGRGRDVHIIEAADYKSSSAKMERVVAARDGRAPILRSDYEKAKAIAQAVADQIGSIEGCEGFAGATPELVAVSQDPLGPWLRIMIDKFEDHGDHAVIWDVKTGEQSAAPMGLGRRIANMGMEVQAALYERVALNLRPELAGRIRFRWLFIENDAPHSLIPAELDNVGMEIGRRKVAAAIHIWQKCLTSGHWPGYPAQIMQAEYPPYLATSWEYRETEDPTLAGVTYGRPGEIIRKPVDMLEEIAP